MRRLAWLDLVIILSVSMMLASLVAPVRGAEPPGYWAGNVQLSQPAMLPQIDDSEAAPMPRPIAQQASLPVVAPVRRVRQAAYLEPIDAPVTNQTRQVLNFYGGSTARATLNQMPQRTPIRPATTGQISQVAKPFRDASNGTTISPYLNLFRDDERESETAPSYFAFVRPQLEQQEAAARDQRDRDRLQRQMQRGSAAGGTVYQSAGGPARYMDTAQFYGGWQR